MTRTSIGDYKVTRRVEDADEIYLVRSPKGSYCHLRLLDPPDDADAWPLARREAELCVALDHPAVGKVLDAFEDDQRLAIVYETIDGESLDKLLQRLSGSRQRLDLEAVWYVCHQLAGALTQAHAAADDDIPAVCHGHLSPRAVAVAWNGFVRLDGLGLAPLVTAASLNAEPAYRPPEEVGGGRVTPRGDCYGLAMLMCTLLSGEAPRDRLSIGAISALLPAVLRDTMGRALESSVGKRRVTSMELEHAFGEIAKPAGKTALADAMAALKRGGGRLATASSPGSPGPSMPTQRRSISPTAIRAASRSRIPSRQATLLGNTPPPARAKLPSKPPAIDWDAATEAAKRPSLPPGELADDFAWGDEAAQSARSAQQRVSASDVAEAYSMAESAVDSLDQVEDLRDAFPGAITAPRPARVAATPAIPAVVPRPSPSGRGLARAEGDAEIEVGSSVDFDDDISGANEEPEIATAAQAPEPAPPPEPAEQPMPIAMPPMAPPPAPIAVPLPPPVTQPFQAPPMATPTPPPPMMAPMPPMAPQPAPMQTHVAPPPPSGASPWSDREPQPAASSMRSGSRPMSISMVVLITLATAVTVLAFSVWWVRRDQTVVPPVAPSSAKPIASVTTRAAPKPKPQPPKPAASAKPPADPLAGKDGSDLPDKQGYLLVRFPKDEGQVYFFSAPQGPVNKKLAVPCGNAFVRVGKPDKIGVLWLSEGRPTSIACQKVTEVTIAP